MEGNIPEYPDLSVAAVSPAVSRNWSTYSLHTILFLATFFTVTLAGVQWLNKDPFDLGNFPLGLPYSLCLLTVLSFHEFGHFFAAKFHQVKTTLPYYIPIPPFLLNPFGTMGAVIRIRSPLHTKKALFDIGIAGPIAGLVPTVTILMAGVLRLPPNEYLFSIPPDDRVLDKIPDTGLTFGYSGLFWFLAKIFSTRGFVPPMNEIYHYPYLCVGWFGLFITALNLIPVGQLDGGHILYAIMGKKQGLIARVFFFLLIGLGLSSFLPFFGWKIQPGTLGWLIWAAILFFLIKIDHPEIPDDTVLGPKRKFLG